MAAFSALFAPEAQATPGGPAKANSMNRLDLLIVLQNAYRPGGRAIPHVVWVKALWHSYTGKRLMEMIPEGTRIAVVNASPQVGTHAGSYFPADLPHLHAAIDETQPRLVLGCGKIAQEGLMELGIAHLPAPHPAWRGLSKKRTLQIRADIVRLLATQRGL